MPPLVASIASDIFQYVGSLVWTCLTLTDHKWRNPVFTIVFAAESVLQQYMSEGRLVFAPSLLGIFQSSIPPSLSFLRSLPTYVNKCWAVYLLILEKPSSRPRIYIGCGTHTAKGVGNRLVDYDAKRRLPRYVQQAVDNGYTITHKKLLCWTPIPDVTIRFPARVLIVLLEAILSIAFWAMISRTNDYGMPRLSPWNSKDITWDGCCSHSALFEGITGEDAGLTVEEITAKLAELDRVRKGKMVVRTTTAQLILRANNKASKRYHCDICNKSYESNHALSLHQTSQMHIIDAAGITKVLSRPRDKRLTDENKAQKRFYCKICDLAYVNDSKLQCHKSNPRHIEKAAKAAVSMTYPPDLSF
jgi:hypothetical protein